MKLKLMLNLLIWLRKNLEWGFQSYSQTLLQYVAAIHILTTVQSKSVSFTVLYESHGRKQETEKLLFIVY